MSVVIYNEELGIFLGRFMGLGFWSKLDPAGQTAAPTFPSDMYAEYIAKEMAPEYEFTYPKVIPDEPEPGNEKAIIYASVKACVAAGLPKWEVN